MKSLLDRIADLHAEIDHLIDEAAAQIKAECQNQPLECIREQQVKKHSHCLCGVALRMLAKVPFVEESRT